MFASLAFRTNNRLIFQPVPGELKMNSKWGLSCHSLFFKYVFFHVPASAGENVASANSLLGNKTFGRKKKNKPLSLFLFSTLAVEKQRKKSVYYPLACSRRTCWCDELSSWVSIYIHKVMGPSRERIWCIRVILLRKCSSLPATQGKCGLK